jgi:hypothetical protein
VAAVELDSEGYGSDEGFESYEEEFEADESDTPVTAEPVTAKSLTANTAKTTKTVKTATLKPARTETSSASSGTNRQSSSAAAHLPDVVEVPQYLLGGRRVTLFGKTLGRALSLLSVARHGLREQELWSLLAGLRVRDEPLFRVTVECTGSMLLHVSCRCSCYASNEYLCSVP